MSKYMTDIEAHMAINRVERIGLTVAELKMSH
jgi:hypothetical protein